MLDEINILAPGKINLFLKVLGKRPDGYHNIRSLIVFINLFDKLRIKKSDKMKIKYLGKFKPKKTYKDCIIIKTLKFLNLYEKENFEIIINKNIPVQGGLGSASTNAAALIRALELMNIIKKKEPEHYISLGSDVPSFLFNKNCLIRGIGEKINFYNLPKFYFLIVKPQLNFSTKIMYRKLNLDSSLIKKSQIGKSNITKKDVGNDFESVITNNNKIIKKIINFLKKQKNSELVGITGSGSCIFAQFKKKDIALKAEKKFNDFYPKMWTAVAENNFISMF